MRTGATARAQQGALLAVGAPLGWLAIQTVFGTPACESLVSQWELYLYMLGGTAMTFGLFGMMLGRREAELLRANRRLAELTVTDALTGLRNARYFHTRLDEESAEAERSGKPLAVLVLDLDHFKRVNDRYGHPVGDDVLMRVGGAIASITRHGETGARVGGEEFAVLLPDTTVEEGIEVSERIRGAIEAAETPLPGRPGKRLRVTASAGVACTAALPGVTARALLREADGALYRAKREGRNRTVAALQPA